MRIRTLCVWLLIGIALSTPLETEAEEIGVYTPSRFAEMTRAADRAFSGRSTEISDLMNAAELKGYVAGMVERMSRNPPGGVPLEKCLRVFGHGQLTARVAAYLATLKPDTEDSHPRARLIAPGQMWLTIEFVCRDIAPD